MSTRLNKASEQQNTSKECQHPFAAKLFQELSIFKST
jgi:hypothetical protein